MAFGGGIGSGGGLSAGGFGTGATEPTETQAAEADESYIDEIIVTAKRPRASGTSKHWNTMHFLLHYYGGSGESVYLNQIGLEERFLNTDEVNGALYNLTRGLELELRLNGSELLMFKQSAFMHTIGDDNPLDPLFSLGSGLLRSVSTCSNFTCAVSYSYSDLFSVHVVGNLEAGGVPYEIYYRFTSTIDFPQFRDGQ
jgi:hypothetical protein